MFVSDIGCMVIKMFPMALGSEDGFQNLVSIQYLVQWRKTNKLF